MMDDDRLALLQGELQRSALLVGMLSRECEKRAIEAEAYRQRAELMDRAYIRMMARQGSYETDATAQEAQA